MVRRPTVREILRLAIAFLLYLGLHPLWVATGAEATYRALVLAVAERIAVVTQHFPLLAESHRITLDNIGPSIVLALALFGTSALVPWSRRTLRFGAAVLAILIVDVAAVILEMRVVSARELMRTQDLLVLLPFEFRLVERAKFLFYDFGLQLVPFLLLAVATAWNLQAAGALPAGRRRRERLVRRRLAGYAAVALGGIVATFALWAVWRETDPRHVETHARLGHLFFRAGRADVAEEQYRRALAGGMEDPEVLYNLANVMWARHRPYEARRLLRRGFESSTSEPWRRRFRTALEESEPRLPATVD